MTEPAALAGFRRRIVIDPRPGRCTVDLEDDYHRMTVILDHDGVMATAVESAMDRRPWTVCPGAREQLEQGFAGRPLADFPRLGDKRQHCTHLYDMILLAGAHAADAEPTVIDIAVSDPIDGLRHAELRRDGTIALTWSFADLAFVAPAAIVGLGLHDLRVWIEGLDTGGQEAARLLRWASMLAHGRTTDMAAQSDPARLPRGTCYTFQDSRADGAVRTGVIRDFAPSGPEPLADIHLAAHRRGGNSPKAATPIVIGGWSD